MTNNPQKKNLLLKHKLATVGEITEAVAVQYRDPIKLPSLYGRVSNKLGLKRLGWVSLYKFKGTSAYSETSSDETLGAYFALSVESTSKQDPDVSEFKAICFDYKNPRNLNGLHNRSDNNPVHIYLSTLNVSNKKFYISVSPWSKSRFGGILMPNGADDEPLINSISYMIHSDPSIKNPEEVYDNLYADLTNLMMDNWFHTLVPVQPCDFFHDIKTSLEFAIRSL